MTRDEQKARSMNKLVKINVNTPICPECGGMLKLNQISRKYLCYHCGEKFLVIGAGMSEREFICERRENGKLQTYGKK